MLKHCVFASFRSDIEDQEKLRIVGAFEQLVSMIDGMIDYSHGPNLDFESKSQDYDAGFIITFKDRESHLAYETHPLHQKLGGELVSMCEGGADGIMVFDLEV